MLNNPSTPGYAGRPRLRVLSGGVELPGCLEASITSNANFQADRFALAFVPPPTGVGSMAWWSAQSAVPVDIQIGFVPPGASEGAVPSWQSMQTGNVDAPDIDFDNNIIHVEGRDLTSLFIDSRTQDAHVNQTSSEVVTALAASHGMTAVVTKTTTPVGRFWSSEHDEIALDQFHRVTTEWDLITTLAGLEGFDAFVQGNTLYFQPITEPSSDPYVIQAAIDAQGRHTGNAMGLRLRRALTVSRGVYVIVKSWNAKQARSFTRGYPDKQALSVGKSTFNAYKIGATGFQQYIFVKPNLTEEQALKYAKQRYDDIIRHEMAVSATLPGDMILTPRNIVQLVGTGTAFDQIYYPSSITRHVSNEAGFSMQIDCKNHNVESQANVS